MVIEKNKSGMTEDVQPKVKICPAEYFGNNGVRLCQFGMNECNVPDYLRRDCALCRQEADVDFISLFPKRKNGYPYFSPGTRNP